MKNTCYPSLGSVSSGTLRPEDLIPAFSDALDSIRESLAAPGPTTEPPEDLRSRREEAEQLQVLLGRVERSISSDDYYETEECDYDLEELSRALESWAPSYCYFGANEGDGADFGFWVDWDSVEGDRWNGDLPSGTDLPDVAEEGSLYLHASDHGNAELYVRTGGDWKSVWSAV